MTLNTSFRKDSGFTLIELMVTVTIAVILATLAVPSFNDLIQRNRMTSQANDLLSLIQYTRSEAVKRTETVSVVITTAADGWQARVDDAGGTTLRVTDYTGESVDLSCTPSPPGCLTTVYNANGRPSAGRTITMVHDPCSGKLKRIINIQVTGRAVIDQDDQECGG